MNTVSDNVRQVESQIDATVRELPLWQSARADVLHMAMQTYRDLTEAAHVELLDARVFDHTPGAIRDAYMGEAMIRAGALWVLKWAFEFCGHTGRCLAMSADQWFDLFCMGRAYETFVDALRGARYGYCSVDAETCSRTITVYEGGNMTGCDDDMILFQQLTDPTSRYAALTADEDRLTSRWTAGDYRRTARRLAGHAASKESIIQPIMAELGKPQVAIPQPTLIECERPTEPPDRDVFDDLTLSAPLATDMKWRLLSLLDKPIVNIEDRFYALSTDLRALTMRGDHMLRLAALVDGEAYNRVSQCREQRMLAFCRSALESASRPWIVRERVRFKDPPAEADVLATRDGESLVLQLKSTLRPEAPWEMHKRNEDLVEGVKQTRSLLDKGMAHHGFVVTNGYRGNYLCWVDALSHGVQIITLEEMDRVARDPATVARLAKDLVGIPDKTKNKAVRLPSREGSLFGWTLRLVDTPFPQKATARDETGTEANKASATC